VFFSQLPITCIGDEREEKWLSNANHIANIHVHPENKIFTKCTHDVLEQAWLKEGI
jgi:hypothetical protein